MTLDANKSSIMRVKFLVLAVTVLATATVNAWEYDSDGDSTVSLQEGDNCKIKTGENGICRRLSSCAVYYEALQQKTIKYSFLVRCSFINTEEVICCPSDGSTSRPQGTTNRTPVGSGRFIVTTPRPTTTKTTTTIKPIPVGDKVITGREPFIDLTKILKTTTTKAPRQIRLENQGFLPAPQKNQGSWTNSQNNNSQLFNQNDNIRRPTQQIFNTSPEVQNSNNNQFLDQRNPQAPERPMSQQNRVRFPTEPTIWKSPQTQPIDPDVEVFNTIENSQDSSPAKFVQFPGQTVLPSPFPVQTTLPSKTQPIVVEQADRYEQFKFRPSAPEVPTPPVKNDKIWGWSTPSTERSVRRTTTTTTTTSAPVLSEWMINALEESTISSSTETNHLLTDWMKDALDEATTTTTSRTVRARTLPTRASSSSPASVTVQPFLRTTPRTADSVTNRENGSERPSQVACQKYRGINPSGLTYHILDGVPVAPGEFPHMGGLLFPDGGGDKVDNRCGSSLISERYVLTAAHCVSDALAQPTHVRLGVVDWNSSEDGILPVNAEIEEIFVHPQYQSNLRYHDVAVIKLRNNVEFTAFVRPACLYSDLRDVDGDTPLAVIGWGVINVQTRARSGILLMTNVTTVPLLECNATHIAYGTSRSYRSGLNDGHYCAFDPELKKDACQSDSGGPLQLVENKESTIVGIVSFGLSCGSAVPSVYARVAYYLDWIEGIVWPS